MAQAGWFWHQRQQQQREEAQKQIEQTRQHYRGDGPTLDECIEQWQYIAQYNKDHPDTPLKF